MSKRKGLNKENIRDGGINNNNYWRWSLGNGKGNVS